MPAPYSKPRNAGLCCFCLGLRRASSNQPSSRFVTPKSGAPLTIMSKLRSSALAIQHLTIAALGASLLQGIRHSPQHQYTNALVGSVDRRDWRLLTGYRLRRCAVLVRQQAHIPQIGCRVAVALDGIGQTSTTLNIRHATACACRKRPNGLRHWIIQIELRRLRYRGALGINDCPHYLSDNGRLRVAAWKGRSAAYGDFLCTLGDRCQRHRGEQCVS